MWGVFACFHLMLERIFRARQRLARTPQSGPKQNKITPAALTATRPNLLKILATAADHSWVCGGDYSCGYSLSVGLCCRNLTYYGGLQRLPTNSAPAADTSMLPYMTCLTPLQRCPSSIDKSCFSIHLHSPNLTWRHAVSGVKVWKIDGGGAEMRSHHHHLFSHRFALILHQNISPPADP